MREAMAVGHSRRMLCPMNDGVDSITDHDEGAGDCALHVRRREYTKSVTVMRNHGETSTQEMRNVWNSPINAFSQRHFDL